MANTLANQPANPLANTTTIIVQPGSSAVVSTGPAGVSAATGSTPAGKKSQHDTFNGQSPNESMCDLRKMHPCGCCFECCTCCARCSFCTSLMRGCANTTEPANTNTNTCSKGLCGMAVNIMACGMCQPCGWCGLCCIDGSWPLAANKTTPSTQPDDSQANIGIHLALLAGAILLTLYTMYYMVSAYNSPPAQPDKPQIQMQAQTPIPPVEKIPLTTVSAT